MGDERGGWAGGGPTPPSVARSNPRGWAAASAALGAMAGGAALALLWRPLPGAPLPPWSLGELAGCAAAGLGHLASARLLGAAASRCAEAWSGQGAGPLAGACARIALAGAAACLPGAALWRGAMEKRDRLVELRGPARHRPSHAAAALRRKLAAKVRGEPDAEIAPGVVYPSSKWNEHLLVVGGTGAGKSTFLLPIMRQALEAGDQALIFDPKGDFTERFPGPAILAPWDARSLAWDIGRDMRNLGDMRRFAESVVDQGGSDAMWSNSARQVLVGLMAALRGERGEDWGFAELAEAMSAKLEEVRGAMIEWQPAAARFVEKSNNTSHGVLSTLASAAAPISDLAMAWGGHPPERRVSMVEWALGRGAHRQLILQGSKSYGPLARAFARPCVEIVSSLVASSEMPEDRLGRKWFFCDEFPALSKVDFRVLVEQGRSRGYRCVLAFQDFAQVEEVHGDKLARALTSMVGTVVVGRMGLGDSAERLAKALGSREVERPNEPQARRGLEGGRGGVTFSRELVPLYLPSELTSNLGRSRDGKSVAMIVATEGDCFELAFPIKQSAPARPRNIPALWTMAQPARASRGTARQAPGGGGDGELDLDDAAGLDGVAPD